MQDPNIRYLTNRNTLRQQSERRQQHRRQHELPFGSEAWVKCMSESYAYWPNYDRRKDQRRSQARRMNRHSGLSRFQRNPIYQSDVKQALLTDEEKHMLNELNKR